jgi:GT2 family glycosyltransferase
MLDELQKDQKFGAVGNRHYRMDDNTLNHAGVMVNLAGDLAHIREPSADSGVTEVAAISAATLLLRRSLFERIGGFDEAFYNGGEDIDLSFRVQVEGLKCGIVQQSSVRHHISASRRKVKLRNCANSLLLLKKWHDKMVFICALTWAKEQQAHLKKLWTSKCWRAWQARSFAIGKTNKPPVFLRRKIEILVRQRISKLEQILLENQA